MFDNGLPTCFAERLLRFIGQTVTVFTNSGGLSGSGFTGVLLCVGPESITLMNEFGAPPACPVCSSCIEGGFGEPFVGNPLGSISVIPICSIAAFSHHAV